MAAAQASTVRMDDGASLYVKVHGDISAKTKPLLIALHGAPGLITHTEPEACFSYLSSNFRVLVFDGRGSGESDSTGPLTHERWMKDIENLRTWAGVDKFVLAGHSYGGFLGLDFAVNYPDSLSGLILIDTWTVGTMGPMGALANILTSNRVDVDKVRQIRVWSGNLLSDQDYEDAITEMMPFYTAPDEVALQRPSTDASSAPFGKLRFHAKTQNFAFGYNMPRFDVRSRLKDIKVPTLVTVGRYDYVTPLHFSEEMDREIPDSQLVIFEHSGHSPQVEETDKFREVVQDFLQARVL